MKKHVVRWTVAVALAGAAMAPVVLAAEEAATKALPTLLIKGEVVSVDTSDAAASLLKVKDRYGFETPIYLTKETKISQGDQAATEASLTPKTAVEVEYNFDINTAKRQAVNVKISPAAQAASAGATPMATPAATDPVAGSTMTETTTSTTSTSSSTSVAPAVATPSSDSAAKP